MSSNEFNNLMESIKSKIENLKKSLNETLSDCIDLFTSIQHWLGYILEGLIELKERKDILMYIRITDLVGIFNDFNKVMGLIRSATNETDIVVAKVTKLDELSQKDIAELIRKVDDIRKKVREAMDILRDIYKEATILQRLGVEEAAGVKSSLVLTWMGWIDSKMSNVKRWLMYFIYV